MTTTIEETQNTVTIQVCCVATRKSFGFIDHYYLILNDYEYHLGNYKKGNKLPSGTTKGSHLICEKIICNTCYVKLMLDLQENEYKRLFSFFPLINCETLVTGISIQSVCLLLIPVVIACLGFKFYLYAIILTLIGLLIHVLYSKYKYSKTEYITCSHL